MQGNLYKITNKINQHSYVGYTSRSIHERFSCHISNALVQNRKSKLYSAIRKYGRENFDIELLYEGNDALEKENEYIEKFKCEYNMTKGGEANQLGRTWRLSEETKSKMRKPKPPRTEEHSKKLSESLKGNTPWNKGMELKEGEVSYHTNYMREYRKGLRRRKG